MHANVLTSSILHTTLSLQKASQALISFPSPSIHTQFEVAIVTAHIVASRDGGVAHLHLCT